MMISSQEYKRRRAAFMASMVPGSVAIFVSPPERQRSHDTTYPYRASSDILYLSGFEEPGSILVLAPGHELGDFVMFVRERDPLREQWDGLRAGPEGALARYGADAAYTLAQANELLPELLANRQTLYYTWARELDFDQRIQAMLHALRYRRNAPSAAPVIMRDARDLVHPLRMLKSEEEIEVMRHAAQISAQAHELAMRACRPGVMEYQLQALIEFHFKRHGAHFPAYTSIVGGGANATILHYIENDKPLRDGDVLLIDAGCELGYYAADITRSFPVSGKFSPAQRDLYQGILEAQEAIISECVPGLVYQEIQQRTARRLTQVLIDMKLLKGDLDQLCEAQAFKTYYPHSTGHWLGIDVHDVGAYFGEDGLGLKLAPGHVITIEPGLYIPEHDENAPAELRGVGIRIEDDLLITPQGNENLTISCPKSIDALEAIVGSGVELSL